MLGCAEDTPARLLLPLVTSVSLCKVPIASKTLVMAVFGKL